VSGRNGCFSLSLKNVLDKGYGLNGTIILYGNKIIK